MDCFFLSLITSSSALFTVLQKHSNSILQHFTSSSCERKSSDVILPMSEKDGVLFYCCRMTAYEYRDLSKVFTHEQATASIGTVKGKLSGKDHIAINQEKLQIKLNAEHIEHTTKN